MLKERTLSAMKSIGTLLAGVVVLPATGHAQDATRQSGGDRFMVAIIDCRAIAEAPLRLECYDARVAALAEAKKSKSIVILNREDIDEKKQQAFGLQQPAIAAFDRRDITTLEVAELVSTVRQVSRSGRDRLLIRLDDGSVWQTLEKSRLDPKAGEVIRIRRAALGSFVGVYGSGSLRMKRLR